MGAVNIDNTGSGASVTLSSDGTDLLLNGSPIGGGGGGASPITISNKTGAYTVVAGDLGTIINCTSGTFTVSLDAAATLGSGFNCWIWNTGPSTTDAITIDPNGSETIDGRTTLILRRGEGTQIVCDGTNWQTGDKKTMRMYAENTAAAVTRPTASGNKSFVVGEGSTASNTASVALGYLVTSSSSYSTAIGNNSAGSGSQAITGSGAMALGGSYASGTDSFAAAVANNTSSYGSLGASCIAIGAFAKANASRSAAIGYESVSGDNSLSLGYKASSLGTGATAIGNVISVNGPQATGNYSCAIGGEAVAAFIGKFAYASGRFSVSGDAQFGNNVLRRATTDATPTVLTTDNTAPGTDDQVILPNNSAYAFSGTVVARQQAAGGTASAAWKIEGLIRREGSAGTTTLVNSALTVLSNVPGWTLALSADTTNGGLAITATGAAATNIRWVATVQTSEVTYA